MPSLRKLKVLSDARTLRRIYKTRCSISRFGDGEIDFMLGVDHDIFFQKPSKLLSEKLQKAFNQKDSRLMICLPRSIINIRGRTKASKDFWRHYAAEHDDTFKQIVDFSYIYGNAQVTRPYIAYSSSRHAQYVYRYFKKIFKDRDIIVIEGNKTRIGVGNDLLDSAKSIRRIIVPNKDAFSQYDKIKQTTLEVTRPDALILAAIGPSATVLAAELYKKRQILDIGHLDIEYEWLKLNTREKVPIPGKYTNEAVNTKNSPDTLSQLSPHDVKKYQSEIIERIAP